MGGRQVCRPLSSQAGQEAAWHEVGWGREVCGSREVFDQNLEQRLSLTVLETRRKWAVMAELMERAVREVTAHDTPHSGFFQGRVVREYGL